jgi:hypothetical protein
MVTFDDYVRMRGERLVRLERPLVSARGGEAAHPGEPDGQQSAKQQGD